jgi:hypothetical protein
MSKDLRTVFENEREKESQMPQGHEKRFEARLDQSFGRHRRLWPVYRLAVAACLLVLLGLVFWQRGQNPALPEKGQPLVQESDSTGPSGTLSLGDLSPDLRSLEQYYMANIQLELASLDISGEHKAMADGYIARLGDLDAEYLRLNRELNEIGPNEQTIGAMIRNLEYRLNLLLKLKEKLNELKSSKNESIQLQSI